MSNSSIPTEIERMLVYLITSKKTEKIGMQKSLNDLKCCCYTSSKDQPFLAGVVLRTQQEIQACLYVLKFNKSLYFFSITFSD